jgi:hypothetical protein
VLLETVPLESLFHRPCEELVGGVTALENAVAGFDVSTLFVKNAAVARPVGPSIFDILVILIIL